MLIDGGPQRPRERTLADWTIDELKNRMFELAHQDPNVLKPLEKVPRESFRAYGEYQKIYTEGKKRAINFELGHNYLCSILLTN